MDTVNKPIIALFDFDGTITTKDTVNDFIIYHFGILKMAMTFLRHFWSIIGYMFKIIDNTKIKNKIIGECLNNISYVKFNCLCKSYATKRLPQIINPVCLRRLNWHLSKNHIVVIVSASPKEWIIPWAKKNGIQKVIASELDVKDGFLTGKIKASKNCHGRNKVTMLKRQIYDIQNYYIYAYGDSSHDKDILNLADKPFFRSFK